jgi:hypothetical protein
MEFFLRTAQGLVRLVGGEDHTIVLVHRAILAANVAHLDVDPGKKLFASVDTPPPDEVRRPVSVRSISQSLGIPFETVRRRVQALVEAGLCKRVKGGIIIPVQVVEGPVAEQLMLGNIANVRRLFRQLRQAGFDFDPAEPRG